MSLQSIEKFQVRSKKWVLINQSGFGTIMSQKNAEGLMNKQWEIFGNR